MSASAKDRPLTGHELLVDDARDALVRLRAGEEFPNVDADIVSDALDKLVKEIRDLCKELNRFDLEDVDDDE